MTRVSWCLGLLLALLGGAAGAQSADPAIKIGEIRSLTGPASFYGVPQSRGLQLAVGEINAAGGVSVDGKRHTLSLESLDDQASPTSGVAALRKLMGNDVHLIIGPVVSGVAAAMKPIIEQTPGMTLLLDGASADGLVNGKTIFRNQANIDSFEAPVIAHVKAKGFPSAALITDRFHAGYMGTEQALTDTLEKLGTKVVAREYYKINDTNFGAQLTKIQALAPAILVMRGYTTETALMVRQARQLGYQGIIAWEGVAPPAAVLKNVTAAEMNGVLGSFPPTPDDLARLGSAKAKTMVENYRKTFQSDPGELSGISYDAAYILKAAVAKAGSFDSAKVNAALGQLKVADVPELVSNYDPRPEGGLFDATGQAAMRGGLHEWRGEVWVPLGPN